MVIVPCPECGYKFELESPELKDRFSCPECWADLQVVDLDPLKLAWFEFEENSDDSFNWDDDDKTDDDAPFYSQSTWDDDKDDSDE